MKEMESLGKVLDYCATHNKAKEIKIDFKGYKVAMETIRYEKKGSILYSALRSKHPQSHWNLPRSQHRGDRYPLTVSSSYPFRQKHRTHRTEGPSAFHRY